MSHFPDAFKETYLGRLPNEAFVQTAYPAQHTSFGVKDLNLKNCYARDKPVSVKEHLQNWRDRCIEIAEALKPEFDISREFVPHNHISLPGSENGWDVRVYCCCELILGWLAMKQLDVEHFQLELFNASTSLTPENVLVLGQSTKGGRAAAGYFGEGVKVEINRLVDSDARVVYFTNGAQWSFSYNQSYVLYATVEPNHQFHQFQPNTTCVKLSNVPLAAFSASEFLFIRPCNCIVSSRPNWNRKSSSLSGLDILLDEHTFGRIYVQGIFVMKMSDAEEAKFGLNYSGICNPIQLGIGRDRDRLNLRSLTNLIPDVFAENKENGSFDYLCKLFYEALPNIKEDEFYFSPDCIKRNLNAKYMADGLLNYFRHLHAELASRIHYYRNPT